MLWRLFLLLMFGTRAWGCACGGNGPSVKQAWQKTPFVFLGTVEVADPDAPGLETIFKEQTVRIHVDEGFKGVSTGQTIELHEGANDCAAKFRTGQRAVFYMYKGDEPNSWVLPACSHSIGSAAPKGDDLLFLRGLPRSARGTRFSGEVELNGALRNEPSHRALSGVRVTVSRADGFTTEAITNEDGVYELYNLSPGRYTARIKSPAGLRLWFPMVTGGAPITGNESAVDLKADGGVSVDFVLQSDTSVAGRVLDINGKPLENVCVRLEPLEGWGENGGWFAECSKEDGSFHMEEMPPGQYWLITNDEVKLDGRKSESTLYYPGVRDREAAKTVSVEVGKYTNGFDIRIPSGEIRRRVTGRVEFQDGVPVLRAVVTFTSEQHGYTEKTNAGEDGSFGFLLASGMEGTIQASVALFPPAVLSSCPQFQIARVRGMISIMDAVPVALSSDSDHDGVKLVLPFASCKAWPFAFKK